MDDTGADPAARTSRQDAVRDDVERTRQRAVGALQAEQRARRQLDPFACEDVEGVEVAGILHADHAGDLHEAGRVDLEGPACSATTAPSGERTVPPPVLKEAHGKAPG